MSQSKKHVSHKNVIRSVKKILEGKSKPQKTINGELQLFLREIVNEEIISNARPEAMKLILQANQREIGELLFHYHSRSTVFPLVIDSIKDRLVTEGKIKQSENDKFGLMYTKDFLESKMSNK